MRTILLLALLPGSAMAQTTNTNCMVNGQWVNCTTSQQSPPDMKPTDFLSGLRGNEPSPPNQSAPPNLRAAWAHLADLIKAHRCEEAIDFAIRQGGTEAGLRTKQLCQ